MLVHLDALRLFPTRYLTAVKWWILRKRVRARGQFAPLLSHSPRAYRLWTMQEADLPSAAGAEVEAPIVALIEASGDPVALQATLNSFAAAGIACRVLDPRADGSLTDQAAAINLSATPWLLPVRGGDLIAPTAGADYLAAIGKAEQDCSLVYADDDLLDARGGRIDPHLKPDWNSELHDHCDFLTGACILRADPHDLTAAMQHEAWAKAIVDRALRRGTVTHLHKVLHHRRVRPSGPMKVAPVQIAERLPPVSVIIPTRNRVNLLRTCIVGLRATHYPDLEIIVANNDSDEPETLAYLDALVAEGVRVLDQPGPFNYSTINNNAVAEAKGELICLLNNDIEVLAPGWLAVMATQALRPEVGAVGAQLLYPDGRIQHAGVVIGVGNAAGHAHRFLRPEAEGYFRRHALPQFISAVTGACLVVRKDKFLAVGGLDEENFAVAFNDVDLCLKLNQRRWQSFYEPRAVLVHHESVSRGFDTDPVGAARFAKELAALQRIWRTNEIVDPYHHPMLSRASEQFALDLTSTMVRS